MIGKHRFGFSKCAAIAAGFVALSAVTAASAAPAAAPQGKPPATQPASPDDPAKVAAARQFIQLYRPQADPKILKMRLDRLMPRMIEAAKKENPKLDAKKFEAERRAKLLEQAAKMVDFQAHIVSRHFSLPELKQLVAFYSSPVGRRLMSETPKIQRDIFLLKPLDMRRPPMRSRGAITLKPEEPEKAAPSPHK